LQQRLTRLGYSIGDDTTRQFGPGTEKAVVTFQRDRGLRGDGICGAHTWSSVVEAGFSLGDRLLYRRAPMLHGDDVADLQRKLSALGFDPGGVDGIFGDQTGTAVADFQHNIGIPDDGIFGPKTLSELNRLSIRRGGEDLVSVVRERLRVRRAKGTLEGRVVVVGETGGFQVGAVAVARALGTAGAHPITVHHPDDSEQADAANTADADCYVGLRISPGQPGVRTFYYRGYRYESVTSKHLAEILSRHLTRALGLPDEGSDGMALPVLRQTRMPAVLIELGAPSTVAVHLAQLADSVLQSLEDWVSQDWS
ncbi:MAG: peptidoglycan-binding protein, partial [Acidimicrobiales bacterium]